MNRADQVRSLRRSFSQLIRFMGRLNREQLACGPITVQQCYCLEALAGGPRSMSNLAAQVGLHQSTVTRIVERLEKMSFVRRVRAPENQRIVRVEVTDEGEELYAQLDEESNELVSNLLGFLPEEKRNTIVESLSDVASLLDPENPAFKSMAQGCSAGRTANGENT